MLPRLPSLVFAMLALGVCAAHGQSLISNGSFESGTNPPTLGEQYKTYSVGATDITGWTAVSNGASTALSWVNGDYSSTPNWFFKPSNGSFLVDLTSTNDNGVNFGGVQQNFASTIGAQYQVSFDLITGAGNSAGPIGATVTAGPFSQTFTTPGTDSTATTFTFTFTANAILTTLTIQGASTPPSGWFLGLDNVSVTAIPEPSTYAALAGLPALGFVAWCRRQTRAPTSRVSSAPC